MRIIIAPDKFKEALSARAVAAAIARGVRRVWPDAQIDCVPMADGGEGTVDALLAATHGTQRRTMVTGPLGTPVEATWGMLGDGLNTAVMEMAAASGLALVPPDRRDPTKTTTYGTGELIRAALEQGAAHVLIGIGGSATTDGGTGAAQACGVAFTASGAVVQRLMTGGDLAAITRIDMGQRHPRVGATRIEVACDVDNPLLGERGAAAVYGPQKGATPPQVQLLDGGLAHLADLIERELGRDVRGFSGAGAAGGLGAGLVAFFDAKLRRGIEMVMDAARLRERMQGADLVITGEGRLDEQSMMGKVIAGVGRAAKSAGVPAVALVGSTGTGADAALAVLDSYHCITPAGMPLGEALARTAQHLEQVAAQVASTCVR